MRMPYSTRSVLVEAFMEPRSEYRSGQRAILTLEFMSQLTL